MISKLFGNISIVVFCAFLIFSCSSNTKDQKIKKSMTGRWEGVLQFTNRSLVIVADISLDKDDNLNVKVSSPRQKAFSLPVDSLEFFNNRISFKIKKFKASYDGEFKIDSSEIVGTWRQENFDTTLIFYRENEIGRFNRPQYPFRPYPYNSDSVSFKNNNEDIILAGTFTYPKKGGPFPAVLLLSGMGPQDRDESMYGHKPFLIISDFLTKHGYAVLRVDDRGSGLSTGNYESSTTKDFAEDALAEINFLRKNKNVDTSRIGVIGFNEGGLIASMLAAKSNYLKYIVLLAAPGIPGKEIMLDQTLNLQKKLKIPEKEIKRDFKFNNKIFDAIESEKDTAILKKKLVEIYKKLIKSLGAELYRNPKYAEGNIRKQINFMIKPWFRYYLTYNPAPEFKKVRCPVLILYGENDLQVDPSKNNEAIVKALKEGGNKNYKSMILPNMNHLFQETDNGSPAEYSKIKETFSPKVMKIILDWMNNIIEKSKKKVVAVK